MTNEVPSEIWVHPEIVVGGSSIQGFGLFARVDIEPGAILITLAGLLISSEELEEMFRAAQSDPNLPYVDTLAVHGNENLVLSPGTIVHFGNHSCDPNMWHDGPCVITARKSIRAGDELTIDYGTQSAAPGFLMTCSCHDALCREVVTSDDWRIAELQFRYEDHWVPALSDRIARSM